MWLDLTFFPVKGPPAGHVFASSAATANTIDWAA